MISKSHVKQCSAWLFLWCYWTSKQCIVKCNVTVHRQNSSLTGFQQDSVWRKHCLKAQRMAVKESTKYWENLRNFLLSSMSPCSRPLLACLLPTGLLSIWQVSFQTDLPSKKIYYFVDYCTALFSSPVIVVKVLKVTTSKQSICHCLISNWEGLGMSLCIMGYLKIWFSGGVWVLSF